MLFFCSGFLGDQIFNIFNRDMGGEDVKVIISLSNNSIMQLVSFFLSCEGEGYECSLTNFSINFRSLLNYPLWKLSKDAPRHCQS